MPLPCTKDAPLDNASANSPKISPATHIPRIAPLCSEKKDFAASLAFFGAVNMLLGEAAKPPAVTMVDPFRLFSAIARWRFFF